MITFERATREHFALLSAGFHLVAQGELTPDNPIDDRAHEIVRIDRW